MKSSQVKQSLIPARIVLSCVGIWLLLFLLGSCRQTTAPNQVYDPVITPPGGSYTQSQLVSLETATPDASIFYTLDGSDPTPHKTQYASPFVVELGTVVKAIATKAGMQSSNVVSALFTSGIAAVEASPDQGVYNQARLITLSCATPLTSIHYTTDGSEPQETSPLYTEPLNLRQKTTLKARAFRPNWTPSPVFSGYYDIRITELLGSCDTPGTAYDVALQGNYAYVADWNGGLQVIDISNPLSPVLKTSCSTPSFARGIAVSGSYAYVADWYAGLQIIDISNPFSPFIAGACDTQGTARDVSVSGNYAYLADGDNGLVAINISDPANPVAVGSISFSGYAKGLCLQDGIAYIAAGNLFCVDISTPATPVLLGTQITSYLADGVAVNGAHAFLANQSATLEILNIAAPAAPYSEASCQLPDEALGIAINQHYACLATKYAGLQVVDINNPTNPSLVRSNNTPGVAYGIAMSENLVCLADGSFGLQLLRLE